MFSIVLMGKKDAIAHSKSPIMGIVTRLQGWGEVGPSFGVPPPPICNSLLNFLFV